MKFGYYKDDEKGYVCGRVDERGCVVERSKEDYPYSYDGFVVWGNNKNANGTVYSDRLFQFDHKKHDDLCMKHFGNKGQYWDKREPKEIQVFLRDFFNSPDLVLSMIMEYCNWSTGYPCWRFDYIHSQGESYENS